MSIQLIIGPMFSGKTENLLGQLSKLKPNEYILIKHLNDVRYSETCVESHSGIKFPASSMKNLEQLDRNSDMYENAKVIAVDEGHFFSNIAEQAYQWALHGKLVLVTAIQTDMYMEALPNISGLTAKADKITLLASYCSHCKAKGLFSYRKTALPKEGNDVERFVGGGEDYTTLCRICFHKRMIDDCEKKLGLFSDEVARNRIKTMQHFEVIVKNTK
jgi:thymidine kinase